LAYQLGTLELLTDQATAALAGVGGNVTDPRRLKHLLAELGWDVSDTVTDIGIDTTLIDAVFTTLSDVRDLDLESDELEDILATYGLAATAAGALAVNIATVADDITDHLGAGFTGIEGEFAKRLIDFLLVEQVRQAAPPVYWALVGLGIFELKAPQDEQNQPHRSDRERRIVHFERIPKLFTNPVGLFEDVYGWGKPNSDLDLLIERLFYLMLSLGAPAALQYPPLEREKSLAAPVTIDETGEETHPELRVPLLHGDLPGVTAEAGVGLLVVPPPAGGSQGLAMTPYAAGTLATDIPLDAKQRWILGLSADVDVTLGVGAVVRPGQGVRVIMDLLGPGTAGRATVKAALSRRAERDGRMMLLGVAGSSGISAQGITVGAGLEMSTSEVPELILEAALDGGLIVIDAGEGDGFLQKILPKDPIEAQFDFGIGWSTKRGVFFGHGRLEVKIPVHVELGPIRLDAIELGMRTAPDSLPLSIAITGGLKLGPIAASVESVGLLLKLTFPPPPKTPPDPNDQVDPVKVVPAFKPPKGVGMAIKAGPVGGGGYIFFDTEKEQYAGILQLDFKTLAIKAIGLLTTRMPDGSKGFSLLVIITAEFPGIQLGYGFALYGVGGLAGLNRTLVADVLRAGIKTGSVGNILFPKDPVARAPQLLSDLGAIFPPAPGRFVFGPMAKLGWGALPLITLELGIVLELPAPFKLVILGRLSLILPDKSSPVLSMNLDSVGIIEFDKGEVSLDATIYDSRLLAFVLSGDIAMRFGWQRPHFEFAAGGMHPDYPLPPGFPSLDRIALSLATGDNPRLRMETYFALTANSFQFGAKLDFHIEVDLSVLGVFSVDAYLVFDVLLKFPPLVLQADLSAGVYLKRNGNAIFVIDLQLHLKGPGPWHAWGQATFDFFGKHTIPLDKTFGPPAPPGALEESHPDEKLVAALGDPINWSAQLPEQGRMLVTLRQREAGDGELLAHPYGELTVRQRVVPLGVRIQRFGQTRPMGPLRFEITGALVGGANATQRSDSVKEYFAPGDFFELSDAEKLSRPGFEAMDAGSRIASEGLAEPEGVDTNFGYEDVVIDVDPDSGFRQRRGRPGTHRPRATVVEGLSRSESVAPDQEIAISLEEPTYVVASVEDLAESEDAGATTAEALTYTEALERLREREEEEPSEQGDLQLVGAHEAVTA
jgi:hypothetical protein